LDDQKYWQELINDTQIKEKKNDNYRILQIDDDPVILFLPQQTVFNPNSKLKQLI